MDFYIDPESLKLQSMSIVSSVCLFVIMLIESLIKSKRVDRVDLRHWAGSHIMCRSVLTVASLFI